MDFKNAGKTLELHKGKFIFYHRYTCIYMFVSLHKSMDVQKPDEAVLVYYTYF